MSQQHFSSSLQAPEPEYEGFWIRFLALFLDTLSFMVVYALFVVPVIFMCFNNAQLAKTVWEMVKGFQGGLQLFGLVVGWLYYAGCEASPWQATLGKKMCGLKVVDLKGEQLTFMKASIRYLAKFISAAPCYVGYVIAAFTQKKQALHDIIAGTVVVKAD
jgi:uncharacterized RDD family membrane protein YckC